MFKSAQCKVILDPKDKSQERFLKLRVSYEREWRTFAIPCKEKFTDDEFSKGSTKRMKEAMSIAEKAKYQAQCICDELGSHFTFTEFKLQYQQAVYGKKQDIIGPSVDLNEFLNAYIQKKGIKPNTQINYRSAISWVKRFDPNATIQSLTPAFISSLMEYISSTILRESGHKPSKNTIGMYLRAIRALCNEALSLQLIKEQPFSEIKIPHAPRLKRAIPIDEWTKFLHYKPTSDKIEFAHDFAILTFSLCGANLADILALKNENISGDTICFVRQKTERVDTNIKVPLTEVSRKILNKYGSISPRKSNNYILPFYAGLSELQQNARRNDIVKKINKGIGVICEELAIERFTTYNIRHTFAVLARDNGGYNAEQLMLLLGHKNITTTQQYLKSISTKLMDDTTQFISDMLS